MDFYKEVERSIITKYRKTIFNSFTGAVTDYELLKEGDKIAVCISGGKDSMLLAKCMQKLQCHGNKCFELVFLVMDPGYSPANRQKIIENAKLLNVPITIFDSDIFDAVLNIEKSPCYLCARMRRGHLYKKAKELGCNKIALGHHFDDVIETVLMSMLYGGEFKTMMPKLHSTNFEGMELIRPLYYVREDDIISWAQYNKLSFLQCACKFTQQNKNEHEESSKRLEMKHLIKQFRATSELIDKNIFKSTHYVNLSTVLGYKENGERHSFLDTYDEK